MENFCGVPKSPQGGSNDTGRTLWDDELNAMASGADGRIILAGKTYGSWGQTNVGEGDFVGLMLDPNVTATGAPTSAPSSTFDTGGETSEKNKNSPY